VASIRIKPDAVRNSNEVIKQSFQNLLDIQSVITSIRPSIDPKVLSRRNINSRLNQVDCSIDELKKRVKNLEGFIDNSMDRYDRSERQINQLALAIKSAKNQTNNSSVFYESTSALRSLEKWNSKEAKLKDSFLGMTEFDWMAPFDGTNSIGTSLDVLLTLSVGRKVLRGFEVIRDKNGKVKITSERPTQRIKKPKGRPRAKYNIFDDSYIRSQANRGNLIEAAAYSKNVKVAAGAALRDKLGYAGIMVDIYSDTTDNINKGASSDKIAGDVLGNVAVGVGAIAVGGATVALLPAAAGVASIAVVGLGVSVGITYLTEGIKWNVDLAKDGEDDSIKDMVKSGFKSGINTVAGWFK
jgi:hypothetical protein